uniref:Uncharacterized protein n=1 Tax=Sphenodon punctatus TaxID=8508 RepID=A0A8D0GX33_SPHPU
MPQPVVSATKQNLPMAVAITVHIAKLNSVHVVEEECLYKSSRNQEPGFIILDQTHHRRLIKMLLEGCGMRKRLRRKKQSYRTNPSSRDQVTYPHQVWTKADLKGSQGKIPLKTVQE